MQPDKNLAQKFLTRFEELGPITFQTFPEGETPLQKRPRILSGSLDEHFDSLELLNTQGQGIFFMVNAGDGFGRKTENVVSVRAAFVDLDSGDLEPLKKSPITPDIIVRSSKSRYHAYWFIEDCPLNEFRSLQKKLAHKFGGDPNVHDLPRVMRVPGFYHLKAEPFKTTFKEIDIKQPVAYATFVKDMGLPAALEGGKSTPLREPITNEFLGVPKGERDTAIFKYGCALRSQDIPKDEAKQKVLRAAAKCKPAFPEAQALAKLEQAYKYEPGHDDTDNAGGGIDESDDLSAGRKKKQKKAKYSDYQILFDAHFGRVEIDIFSNKTKFYSKSQKSWVPLEDELLRLKSKAYDSGGYYSPAAVEAHLATYSQLCEPGVLRQPKLLVDIPDWDGVKRLETITECIKCRNYDYLQVYEILAHFGAGVFKRLYTPSHQSEVLILRGGQGLGKDVLIHSMFGGLGEFFVPFSLQPQAKDNYGILSSGLIMWLSEYITSQQEQSVLKHLITADRAYFRRAYARSEKWVTLRSSWIASTNDHSVLRDATGNRRFVILDIQSIKWTYPTDQSLQILAEMRQLYRDNYEMSPETRRAINEHIASETPDSIQDLIVEDIQSLIAEDSVLAVKTTFTNDDLASIFEKVEKAYGVKRRFIQTTLKQAGYQKRVKSRRCYCFENEDDMLAEGDANAGIKGGVAGTPF